MTRPLILALASTAALMTAGAAHAGSVSWSIGISAPGITTVVSNAQVREVPVIREVTVYRDVPVVVAPAPVVVDVPPHVVFGPPQRPWPEPQVVYRPVPPRAVVPVPVVVYRPAPVVYDTVPRWVPPGHRGEWRRDGWREERREDRREWRDWRRDERRHGHGRDD